MCHYADEDTTVVNIPNDGGTTVYLEANADEHAVITRHHLCSYNLRYFIAGEFQWARQMTTASEAAVFLRRFGFPYLEDGIKRLDPEYQTDAEIRELLASPTSLEWWEQHCLDSESNC